MQIVRRLPNQLFLVALIIGISCSANGQDTDTPIKLLHSIFPSAFLQKDTLTLVKFTDDDNTALVVHPSFTGCPAPRIDVMDCHTGEIQTIVEMDHLYDVSFPDGEQSFVVAAQRNGKIEVNRFDLKGKRIGRASSIKSKNDQSVRVFWQPELEQTTLVHKNIVNIFTDENSEKVLTLDDAPQRFASCVHGRHLIVGVNKHLQIFDTSSLQKILDVEMSNSILTIAVSSDASSIWVNCGSRTQQDSESSTLVQLERRGQQYEITRQAQLEFAGNRLEVLNENLVILSSYLTSLCFDIKRSKEVWRTDGQSAFLNHSKNSAALSGKMRIEMIDALTAKKAYELAGHSHPIIDLAYDPQNQTVKTMQFDGHFFHWDLQNGTLISHKNLGHGHFHSGDLARNRFTLTSKTAKKQTRLIIVDQDQKLIQEFDGTLPANPFLIRLIDENRFLCVNQELSTLSVYPFADGKPTHLVSLEKGLGPANMKHKISTVNLSAPGGMVAIGISTRNLFGPTVAAGEGTYVFDLNTGSFLYRTDANAISGFGIDEAHDLLVTPGNSTIEFFRLSTGKHISNSEKIADQIMLFSRFAFSPNGRFVAASTSSPFGMNSKRRFGFVICEISTGKIIGQLGQHENFISLLKFSPDSTQLFSCGQDGMINVWDVSGIKRQDAD